MDHPVIIDLDWRHLSLDDLRLVADQAETLRGSFPERPGVREVFGMLVASAVWQMYTRGSSPELGALVPPDESAPFDQQIDDLGVAMAHVMPLVEHGSLPPSVQGLWNDVLRNLAREIRGRQRRR